MHNRIINSCGAAVLASATLLLAVAIPADAHHSFAMYDQTEDVTMTGRLVRFIPGGNHAQLIFQLVDEAGEVRVDDSGEPLIWGVETGPSAAIAQAGITVKSFPLGTVLTVTLNPLRDGRNFGALARGTSIIRCGDMPADGCTPATGELFLGIRE